MQHFVRLRMLKLDGCKQLKSTPDFTGAQSLQEISFFGCLNLANVHSSIGSLEKLVRLNLRKCKKLKVLPTSICKLKSLEELLLCGCKNLRELPIDIGKLEQLRQLRAQETGISHLPFSLGCLRNLEYLRLGNLVGSVAVDFLPSSAANLCSLDSLTVNFNKLQQVVINFPIALWSLTSLRNLSLEGIRHLESPLLDLSHLSNLKGLYLKDLQNLRALLKLPPSLIICHVVNCESLEKISDISNLRSLYELNIVECKSLIEFSGLESLKYLTSLAIGQLNAMHECLQISLELSILKSLTYVEIRKCSALRIPSIENWFQAHCKGNTVPISLDVIGQDYVCCSIPRLYLRHTSSLEIVNNVFGCNVEFDGVGVSVRSKTTGAWIVKEPPKHININEFEKIEFEVGTRIGEVLEVYAHLYLLQMEKMLLCLFEIHRNEDGEVRFFPSTRDLEEIDDGTTDNVDGCLGSSRQNENRLMIEEGQNGWSRSSIVWEFILKCFCWDEQGR
ncbi:disease resistance protein RPP4-like [Ipomoea triloba]|nr:disease resistance protein RPP4-like [Ipomoea triloba]